MARGCVSFVTAIVREFLCAGVAVCGKGGVAAPRLVLLGPSMSTTWLFGLSSERCLRVGDGHELAVCVWQCADGYTGTQCAQCKLHFYRLGSGCSPCPSLAWLYITAFVLALLVLVYGAYWLNKMRINLAALGIGVDFMQVGRPPHTESDRVDR